MNYENKKRMHKNQAYELAMKWLNLAKSATNIKIKLSAMQGYHRNMVEFRS